MLKKENNSEDSHENEVLQGSIKNIIINKLTFCYPDTDNLALDNIDLMLEYGKKYVLVGSSGSGKSTLLNVLTKLRKKYAGKIEIDGKELAYIDESSLRKKITFIQQSPFIFHDTLEYNICLGYKVKEEQLNKVIELVNLNELVNKLPAGIKTILSDNGNNLSGGEKQRIAFARAIIRNPEILFVDEGMSALDTKNTFILENLLQKHKGMSVTISHKNNPEVLKNSDKIIVMDSSKIVAIGDYNEVVKSPFSYLLNVFTD